MRLAGRVSAAIEILAEIFERHRPASDALRDWGKAHRFAGSADRHAIGTLVYDCLRKRLSLGARMQDQGPRALALAALRDVWSLDAKAIATLCTEQHGPGALSEAELTALSSAMPQDIPLHVKADLPDWLLPSFEKAFGNRVAEEGAALARRAPIDLRVNTLKTSREDVLKALERFHAKPGPLSPFAVRIAAPGPDSKHVNVEAEPAHGRGWYEVQDAASQLAALMSGAKPGETVADICAGAGGKTLALAAMMENKGSITAYDADRHRLRPIFERIQRAGASNIDVIGASEAEKLKDNSFDCVVIDAPCTGSGAWRRKPDAKWRLTPQQLEKRLADQRAVLATGAKLVKTGGRLLYITCSVLPEENGDQVRQFLKANPSFRLVPPQEQWKRAIGGDMPQSQGGGAEGLLLTPAQHDTDGFFMSVVEKT